jgi:hypothetical protein
VIKISKESPNSLMIRGVVGGRHFGWHFRAPPVMTKKGQEEKERRSKTRLLPNPKREAIAT